MICERVRGTHKYGGLALAVAGITAVLIIGLKNNSALAQSQDSSAVFLPDGKLKLPTGFRNWVFVGGPLTPNGLNGGKANFPGYVEARNLDAYRRAGSFLEGALIVKDGSRTEPTPSHDSNCAVSPILSLVFIVKTPFNTQ